MVYGNGTELLLPGEDGTIIPSGQYGGANVTVVQNISGIVRGDSDIRAIADESARRVGTGLIARYAQAQRNGRA